MAKVKMPNPKLRVTAKADSVVSLPRGIVHPRGTNAIIVAKLEPSILISVTARYAYVVIDIRMTIKMVSTVRVIP